MTRHDVALRCLDLIDRTPADANAAERRSIVTAINSAMQEIADESPREFFKAPFSGILRPSTPVTIDVNEDSTAMEIQTNYQPWMVGCSIQVDGDDRRVNRIEDDQTFYYDYLGPSIGPLNATVWGDSLEMPSDMVHVLGGVRLDGTRKLEAVANEVQDHFMAGDWWDSNSWDYNQRSYSVSMEGEPRFYYIERKYRGRAIGETAYMRFRSLPDTKYRIQGNYTKRPELWVEADVTTSTGTGAEDTNCPGGYDDSILVPLALQNMTYTLKFEILANENTAESQSILTNLYENAEQARMKLRGMRAQTESNFRIEVVY